MGRLFQQPKCSSAILRARTFEPPLVITGFQLCCRTAKRSTLHMKLICAGKNGKPSKQNHIFKYFMFLSSSFAPEGELPGESGLDCRLRKHDRACVYFQNSHPGFGCCLPGETREVLPSLLHTALTDWCSVPRNKRNACPKIISRIFERNKPYHFFPGFLVLIGLLLLFNRRHVFDEGFWTG